MDDLKWTIGDVEIFQIVELEAGKIIQNIIEDATPQKLQEMSWLYPYFVDEKGNFKAQVASFLIKVGSKNILVDTCNGNDKVRNDFPEWGNLHTNFLQKLDKIGEITKTDIDFVINTHLHTDHVGWNTELEKGIWVPTFLKAKYLFVQEEYDYWKQKPDKEMVDDNLSFDDSIVPVVKAKQAKFVNADFKIDQHVSLLSTPGHTPGHVSIAIESQGEHAIISGDLFLHPCQIAHPEWAIAANTFPDKAFATRKNILAKIVDTKTLFIGSHFADPVAGRVISSGSGFVFEV